MHSLQLDGLIQQVQSGDATAMDHLQRMLRTVVGRAVRRVLQTEDYGTPLGQRIRGLLAEVGTTVPQGRAEPLESTAHRITQAICGQTVARLRSEGRSACDTVLA